MGISKRCSKMSRQAHSTRPAGPITRIFRGIQPLRLTTALILLILVFPTTVFAEKVEIGAFSQGTLDAWKPRLFNGKTDYQIVLKDGQQVLQADSRNAASGLVRTIRVDLRRTPYLHWRWKISRLPPNSGEKTKSADDFPVRVYLIQSAGLAFWNSRALNYVWSATAPVDTWWPNPYTGKAIMLAVESGPAATGKWREYHRNVLEDFKKTFGVTPESINSVAIMTDTDNTGTSVTAWYGDLYFSDQ